MQTQKNHWPSLILLVIFASSFFLLVILSAVTALISAMDLFAKQGDPAGEMISAFAFGFIAFLLGLCCWFVLQKTLGKENADFPVSFPFPLWQTAALIGVFVVCISIGVLITVAETPWLGWLTLPIFTILVVVPPIWLIFNLGTKDISLGSRWQFFAVLGVGMTIGPVLMIITEIVLLVGMILFGAVYLSLSNPDLLKELSNLGEVIRQTTDEQTMMNLLTPYITNPAILITSVVYIALFVPLIEELLKPLALWVLGKRIASPAQGFALGMLSGAAFALIESLNASSDGSISWGVIVGARTGTSILHMTSSSLVGWGIASAFKGKRWGRLTGAYLSAVLIHGVWNACAAGAGISAIGESLGKPEWVFNYTPAMICGLLVMGIGMVAVVLASNRKLRHSEIQPIIEEKVESPA